MQVIPTAFPEVKVIVPRFHRDERGSFSETYNRQTLRDVSGFDAKFVQDSRSRSGPAGVYNFACDDGRAWNDPALKIDWHCSDGSVLLCTKDRCHPTLIELPSYFMLDCVWGLWHALRASSLPRQGRTGDDENA